MANPRKFSEKIALHNQKQAEETAAFEKIMREVSDATNKPEEIALAHQYAMAGGRSSGTSPSPRSPGQRGRPSSSPSTGQQLAANEFRFGAAPVVWRAAVDGAAPVSSSPAALARSPTHAPTSEPPESCKYASRCFGNPGYESNESSALLVRNPKDTK
ncbi:unnamed protein product [Leptidea sinapis]|uniref:Transducer of regulated CREB activity N-terminal domain-containing protein n=1 Tax=Leptidea sinapis TaxID=189913 RepID=A0A5E4QKL6_9NEOP|nr:unnamed protein product [Leptidea sinapis]